MNPFEAYAKQATSQRPARLLGPVKTRGALRERYDELTKELAQCGDIPAVENWLAAHARELLQFRAEAEFLWFGDGDFLGLEHEIARAQARVDDRLDMPRRG